MPMNGPGQILPAAARAFGSATALVTSTKTLSFEDLDRHSDAVACGMRDRGVALGDRVSIYAQNRWEWIVAYHGALKAGAVVNPINVMLTPAELRFVLRDCGARMLLATAASVEALGPLEDLPDLACVVSFDPSPHAHVEFTDLVETPVTENFVVHVPDPKAPSTIGYTSGTTGHPKGAVQSHEAVLLNCEGTARMHGRDEHDVVLSALPAPHVYGNVVINGTFMVGGTVVLMERWDAARALELIAAHRVTLFEGVPAMYSMLLASPELDGADLTSLTRCTVGGQTIGASTVAAWEKRCGAPLIELWGMTELAGPGSTHWHDRRGPAGSIGLPLPGVELRIADFDDVHRTPPPGEPGELMARGPLVMLGYWNNPLATEEAIEPDGWMHTGDVAYVDDDGYFFIVDRRKDMLITAGYNIYPAEIERVVAAHPSVALVAVGSVPDEVKGELARAYVVLRPGAPADAESIVEFCRERLAAYKVPRSVVFVQALPQTSTGKLMRRALRDLDVNAAI